MVSSRSCFRSEVGKGLISHSALRMLFQRSDGAIRMGQSIFAEKLEPLELTKERKRDLGCPAFEIEIAGNRSLIGNLGWLATQARPDLAAGVSMAQR
eukprot:6932726-Pyramimonas_sp.AAC.1